MIKNLILGKLLLNEMVEYVNQRLPLEACGLLAGKNGRVEKMIGVMNQAQSPVRFVMNPREQLNAIDWIESHDLDLLGIFHSHPTGPETVSPTDIAEAAYPVVHIVLAPRGHDWQTRGFWIDAGLAVEVTLQIEA